MQRSSYKELLIYRASGTCDHTYKGKAQCEQYFQCKSFVSSHETEGSIGGLINGSSTTRNIPPDLPFQYNQVQACLIHSIHLIISFSADSASIEHQITKAQIITAERIDTTGLNRILNENRPHFKLT